MEFSGYVHDSSTNSPLPGATLVGIDSNGNTTGEGTVSDANGNYTLSLSDNNTRIQVSYIGYQTKQISVDQSISFIGVSLDAAIDQLPGVTITAPAPNPSPITAGPVQTLKKTWISLLIIFSFAFLVSESQERSTKRRRK